MLEISKFHEALVVRALTFACRKRSAEFKRKLKLPRNQQFPRKQSFRPTALSLHPLSHRRSSLDESEAPTRWRAPCAVSGSRETANMAVRALLF